MDWKGKKKRTLLIVNCPAYCWEKAKQGKAEQRSTNCSLKWVKCYFKSILKELNLPGRVIFTADHTTWDLKISFKSLLILNALFNNLNANFLFKNELNHQLSCLYFKSKSKKSIPSYVCVCVCVRVWFVIRMAFILEERVGWSLLLLGDVTDLNNPRWQSMDQELICEYQHKQKMNELWRARVLIKWNK